MWSFLEMRFLYFFELNNSTSESCTLPMHPALLKPIERKNKWLG